jgi:protein-S-isoprenylcysteine O-methyltransferase Ste14
VIGCKTIPSSLMYGSILLALVLLVVAIWGFGGFKKRTDTLKTTPPGSLFTTGPYEFRFTEATAQHWTDYDGTVYWSS